MKKNPSSKKPSLYAAALFSVVGSIVGSVAPSTVHANPPNPLTFAQNSDRLSPLRVWDSPQGGIAGPGLQLSVSRGVSAERTWGTQNVQHPKELTEAEQSCIGAQIHELRSARRSFDRDYPQLAGAFPSDPRISIDLGVSDSADPMMGSANLVAFGTFTHVGSQQFSVNLFLSPRGCRVVSAERLIGSWLSASGTQRQLHQMLEQHLSRTQSLLPSTLPSLVASSVSAGVSDRTERGTAPVETSAAPASSSVSAQASSSVSAQAAR